MRITCLFHALGATCLVSSLTLLGAPVAAQAGNSPAAQPAGPAPVKVETMHLQVSASMPDGDAVPGKRLSLVVDVTPKPKMHVYAPGKHDYQVITIRIDPLPWLKVSPTAYPASEIYDFKELNEKVEVYSKPFRLVQDLAVLATPEAKKALAASPTVTLTGKVEYQACDDRVCYAPAKIPVSFALTVKASQRSSGR